MTDAPQPSGGGPAEGRPPQGPAPTGPWGPRRPPKPRRSAWSIVATILLVLSVLANVFLLLMLVAAAGLLVGAGGMDYGFEERVVRDGDAETRIAVVRAEGMVLDEMAASVARQLDAALDDESVRAVILRINSPGGGLTASDMIHHAVARFKERAREARGRDVPVVAAMDALAASGGYYIACAADHVVAQPTTITGSIGIRAQLFFLNDLLAEKLGVKPVTLKVGDRKDWPNIFEATELGPDQREYLMTTLLEPGYDRFVDVVAEARGMEREKVVELANGQIYLGPEAHELGLVDAVGFLEDAIDEAAKRAGIADPEVFEYRPRFSLARVLGVETQRKGLGDLGPEDLAEKAMPRLQYLWTGE